MARRMKNPMVYELFESAVAAIDAGAAFS